MAPERRAMSLQLSKLLAHRNHGESSPRPMLATDAAALSDLMFEAYRGSIDDHGESREDARAEIEKTFSGGYGRMLWEASFVASDLQDDRKLAGASLLTLWRDAPLLAFSMTRPTQRRAGLARSLIVTSAHALILHGHTNLTLVVTTGNTPAERLYESLGFEVTEVR